MTLNKQTNKKKQMKASIITARSAFLNLYANGAFQSQKVGDISGPFIVQNA